MRIRNEVEQVLTQNVERLKIFRDRMRESENAGTRDHYDRRMNEVLKSFELLNYAIAASDNEIEPRLKQLIAMGWDRKAEIGTMIRGILARAEQTKEEME